MNKNELLLLAEEYFTGFTIELADDPDHSRLHSEMGQDVSEAYFLFVKNLLRLHGVEQNT
jgi:hypothetical protein